MSTQTPIDLGETTEKLARIGRELNEALAGLAAQWNRSMQRRSQAMEVAALFELHRQLREADGPEDQPMPAPAREVQARLEAAILGYDTDYLEQLAAFAAWLANVVGRERLAR